MLENVPFDSAAPDSIHDRAQGVNVDRIVMHVEEGSYRGTLAWFKDITRKAKGFTPTAAHFVTSLQGDITQMVPLDKICWHCGSKTQPHWNDRAIGIEMEGFTAKGYFPDAMLKPVAALVADLCKHFNIPADRTHIIGHCEIPGVTHTDPGSLFPWDTFMSYVLAAQNG